MLKRKIGFENQLAPQAGKTPATKHHAENYILSTKRLKNTTLCALKLGDKM